MPPSLNDLINAIPVAQRGDVISPESHNSLRAVVAAIAAQLGAAPSAGPLTLTFSPALLPMRGETPWDLLPGVAANPAGGNAIGWLPLALPDGARIQRLTIVGGRSGPLEAPSNLLVRLQRQFVNGDGAAINLINITLRGPSFLNDPFEASGPYAPIGLPAEQIEPARVIDANQFKYMLRVELRNLQPGSIAMFYGFRIECQRS